MIWNMYTASTSILCILVIFYRNTAECISEVCYNDQRLGCFRLDGDFNSSKRLFSTLPESPEKIDTKFYLYLRGKKRQEIKYGDLQELKNSGYNASIDTKFIIHGLIDDGSEKWIKVMVKELLINGPYNVIVVDWGSGSGNPYNQATANSRVVGAVVARFIDYLKDNMDLCYENCHLIGFSLGAHIAGYAGERLDQLGRITGLDPAGFLFNGLAANVKLDPTDAKFVDIIHTDFKSMAGIYIGTPEKSGHKDFFLNNGQQPGCSFWQQTVSILKQFFIDRSVDTITCHHYRAIEIFSDSINSKCQFTGIKCTRWQDFIDGKCNSCGSDGSNCAIMGFHVDKSLLNSSSSYYLGTGSSQPFCVYNYHVTVELDSKRHSRNQFKNIKITLNGIKEDLKIKQFGKSTLTLGPGKSYSFLAYSKVEVGKINNVDIEWKFSSSIIPKFIQKYLWNGIKLYITNIKFRQIDVHNSKITQTMNPVFCKKNREAISLGEKKKFFFNNKC